ncbi:ABC transporter substrate-binding protein [Ureibacillus acetophenoni]|uniref:Peptide/nickel transport system substrate-binding protein n=1 Tax=Ureibacillus acetophenoni TaxID=614649 RepID=A0A285UEJ3_9BACL|nr:ABC transporter substrate-binding protein [Ureibacillus acetophenoni]SOC40183.1 peptide/nickel transport system substrate-binding protein [Ureibacillus acetophenoni]
MKISKKLFWITIGVLTLILVGCGSNNSGVTADEKVLTIGRGEDIITFDPHNHTQTNTKALTVNIYNSLVRDNDGEIEPIIAESWEIIEPDLWEFKLHENITFHNGDKLTAEDVKFSLERIALDETLLGHDFSKIQEVIVVDEYKVQIKTDGPAPSLLQLLTMPGGDILPKKYIEENGIDHFIQNPIGSGPYKFVEWKKDDRVVLEKNPDYFLYEPKWDKLVFRVIPESSTRLGELLTGGVDMITNVPPSDWERIKNNDETELVQGPVPRVFQLVTRMTEGTVTADPRVREAIELAIDSEAITKNILMGAATPTRTQTTPTFFGANKDLHGKNLYDPERAKQLLKEAGYENGVEINIGVPNGRYIMDKEIGEAIQAMLTEVGFKVNMELLESSRWNDKYRAKSFDELYVLAYSNAIDAGYSLSLNLSERAKGETDFNNAEFDELLEAASVNMDPVEREKQYQRAQEILAEERPRIFLFQYDQTLAISDTLLFTPRLDESLYADEIILK